MQLLYLPSSLLQLVEGGRLAGEAVAGATAHIGQQGPLLSLLWALVLLLALVCCAFYLKAERALRERQEACVTAVAVARQEWARQQAIDNGHAAELLRQSREQEREALDRLELINRELRQQEVKSVEVIGGVRAALTQLSTILHGVQLQLQGIEATLATRPGGRSPARAPTLPIPPTLPL